MARCATVLVAGTACGLVALVVRHRGPVASLAAGLALACFPLAVTADQTVLLEPYLAAACLLGAVLAFRDGELVTGQRALWAGTAFGVAGAIKVWAVLPVIALALCCIGRGSSAKRLALGALAGFALPCLPFFLLAPSAFVDEVLLDQLRRSGGSSDLGLVHRLDDLTSLAGWPDLHAPSSLVVALTGTLLALIVVSYALLGADIRPADWFVLLTAALVLAAVLTSREFYEYYAYFPAVFVAAVIGVSAGAWVRLAERHATGLLTRRAGLREWLGPLADVRVGAAIAVLLAAAAIVPTDVGASHAYLAASGLADPAGVVDRYVPPGACALTDESIVLIVSDRYVPSRGGCPAIVDSFGTWLAADPRQLPPDPGTVVPGLAASWRRWLATTRVLVLSVPMSDYIPWTASLTSWFDRRYRLVAETPKAWVYERVRVRSSAPQARH